MSDSPTSLLGQLKQKHKEIIETLTIDLKIEGWTEPEIWVRYQPVGHADASRVRDALLGGNMGDALSGRRQPKRKLGVDELNANMDLLIKACIGVYGKLDGDDTEYSLRPNDPTGPLTKFDDDLGENIGVDEPSARAVVLKLFLKEGAIMAHASRVVEFSGYAEAQAEDDLAGE